MHETVAAQGPPGTVLAKEVAVELPEWMPQDAVSAYDSARLATLFLKLKTPQQFIALQKAVADMEDLMSDWPVAESEGEAPTTAAAATDTTTAVSAGTDTAMAISGSAPCSTVPAAATVAVHKKESKSKAATSTPAGLRANIVSPDPQQLASSSSTQASSNTVNTQNNSSTSNSSVVTASKATVESDAACDDDGHESLGWVK